MAALVFGLSAAGCSTRRVPLVGPGSLLRLESQAERPVVLEAQGRTVVYTTAGGVEQSFFFCDAELDALLDGSLEQGQVVHIELLWEPKAGSTPLASTATNASIRHYVFSNGEVGVYAGAGFAMPQDRLGRRAVGLALRDASLNLRSATDGFVDLVSPGRLSGSFTAEHDEATALQIRHALRRYAENSHRGPAIGSAARSLEGDRGSQSRSTAIGVPSERDPSPLRTPPMHLLWLGEPCDRPPRAFVR